MQILRKQYGHLMETLVKAQSLPASYIYYIVTCKMFPTVFHWRFNVISQFPLITYLRVYCIVSSHPYPVPPHPYSCQHVYMYRLQYNQSAVSAELHLIVTFELKQRILDLDHQCSLSGPDVTPNLW